MKPMSFAAPHLIILVGIPGAGKSFFGEHFASTFNAPYISIEKLASDIFDDYTRSDAQQVALVRATSRVLKELFKTNQTIVIDSETESKVSRHALIKTAYDNGYAPLIVWVQTESITAKTRSTKPVRGKYTLTNEQFDAALRRFTPPDAAENPIVISGKHTYPSQLKIVLTRLASSPADALKKSTEAPRGQRRHTIIR